TFKHRGFIQPERIHLSELVPETASVCLEGAAVVFRPAESEYGVWVLTYYSFAHTTVSTGADVSCTGKALDMCTDTTQMTFDTCKSDVANS
ncbi:hypothetical protein MAR_023045, partial [Mya arenaria]